MAKTGQSPGSWGSMFGKRTTEKKNTENTGKKEARKTDDREVKRIEKELKEEREKMKRQEERQKKEREKRREDLDKQLEWSKKTKKKHFHLFGSPERKRRKRLEKERKKAEKRRKELAEKRKEQAQKLAKERAKQAEKNRKKNKKRQKQLEKERKEKEREAEKMGVESEKQAGRMANKAGKEARKTGPVKTETSVEMPAGIKPKKILHDLYFSKKLDEKNASLKDIYRDMGGYEKEIEKRLVALENQTDKRIDNIERTMTMIRDIVDGLRRENEELRKDRQFFVEKYKSTLNESALISSEEKVLEAAEEEAEKTGSVVTSYAEHGTSRNVETSMDTLLEIINKKGTIRLSVAAKKLGVKTSEAEEWVHMLEEHDLIDVHYPTFGSPILKKKGK